MLSVLQRAIDAAGGWLGFDAFMALALYTPGLGYYASGMKASKPSQPPAASRALCRTDIISGSARKIACWLMV